MTHTFFEKSEADQKRILWKIGGVLLLGCLGIAGFAYLTEMYWIGFGIPLLILTAAPFIDLPMGTKSGKFRYHSPFLISEAEQNNLITIHGGTLFDYYYTVPASINGAERTRYVLKGYMLGLINLISEYEDADRKGELKVRGTSYILNTKTAKRFGLQPVKTDALQFMILLFNYIPLAIAQSFIKQGFHVPRISEIKTYEGAMSELAEQKEQIKQLYERLDG